MIGDKGLTVLAGRYTSYARPWVDLTEAKIDYDLPNLLSAPNAYRSTTGIYFIIYRPFLRSEARGNDDYIIVSDLFAKGNKRVKDYECLVKHAQTDLELAWLVDNTNINKTIFEIAKNNFGMSVPFCFEISKYSRKTKSKKFRTNFMEVAEMEKYKAKREAKGLL